MAEVGAEPWCFPICVERAIPLTKQKNPKILVVDREMKPASCGVIGCIHVQGSNMTRGRLIKALAEGHDKILDDRPPGETN